MIEKWVQFFKKDIWELQEKNLSTIRGALLFFSKSILLAVRNFFRDQCPLRATALTLYTLLSVVPVLALAFGIAKGFGFEKHLQEQILQQVPEQEEVLKQILVFAKNLLETTKGGVVAGVGILVLLWSVINIFGQIEDTLNQIWSVKKGRTLGRKFSDYLSMMLIFPIVMILSGSITVYLASQAEILSEKAAFLDVISKLLLLLLKWVPYVIFWVFFSFIYLFMPNRKIPFRAGLSAGIVAGTLYQGVQWAYIALQVGVAKYNAIYGSFAALPLFLVWLQLSWNIVLFGAELSFSFHNSRFFRADMTPEDGFSRRAFKLMALQISHAVVKDFKKGSPPLSVESLSARFNCAPLILKEVVDELISVGILSAIKSDDDPESISYQPGRHPERITIGSVSEALERRGSDRIPLVESREMQLFRKAQAAFSKAIQESSENKTLQEI